MTFWKILIYLLLYYYLFSVLKILNYLGTHLFITMILLVVYISNIYIFLKVKKGIPYNLTFLFINSNPFVFKNLNKYWLSTIWLDSEKLYGNALRHRSTE